MTDFLHIQIFWHNHYCTLQLTVTKVVFNFRRPKMPTFLVNHFCKTVFPTLKLVFWGVIRNQFTDFGDEKSQYFS